MEAKMSCMDKCAWLSVALPPGSVEEFQQEKDSSSLDASHLGF